MAARDVTIHQRRNKMGDGLDAMKAYREPSKTRNGAPASAVALTNDGEIIVSNYELMRGQLLEQLGDRYVDAEDLLCL